MLFHYGREEKKKAEEYIKNEKKTKKIKKDKK